MGNRGGGGTPGGSAPAAAGHDDSGTVWAFMLTLFGFKMLTVVVLLFFMRTRESNLVIAATTWYWFPLLAVLGAAPLMYRHRLRKARARRAQLLRSEWMVTEDDGVGEGAATGRR